jgi:hypothetical protein
MIIGFYVFELRSLHVQCYLKLPAMLNQKTNIDIIWLYIYKLFSWFSTSSHISVSKSNLSILSSIRKDPQGYITVCHQQLFIEISQQLDIEYCFSRDHVTGKHRCRTLNGVSPPLGGVAISISDLQPCEWICWRDRQLSPCHFWLFTKCALYRD